ncbi:MAG: heat-shock protein Hsp20 [Spirochaetales bacterium]|nr:MAG: heat-shock protein Hsp20 [Spirochaetales bacterium]
MEIMKYREPAAPSYWNSMKNLQQEINALFDDDFFPASTGLFDRTYSPAVDVIENENNYLIRCELPGLSSEDIDVQVADNVLTVKGEKKARNEESEKRWYKKESWYGSFQRTISMPSGVDAAGIKGELENGILKVTLPKKEEMKPRQISVNVK